MFLLGKIGRKSVFRLAFLSNKSKRPHILDLSITRLDFSFEIEKLKIERLSLGKHGHIHGWSPVGWSGKMASVCSKEQDQKIRSIEKL